MSNAKNLKINQIDKKNISFKELSLIKDMIFWVDIIPDDQTNKNAIFAKPFNDKNAIPQKLTDDNYYICLLYTSPSPRDGLLSRMPSSA